jgi:hypothetical protein
LAGSGGFLENSFWGADVYIVVTNDVPGAGMTTISETFLSKVFEGPYYNMRKWIEEMKQKGGRRYELLLHQDNVARI